MLNKLLVVDDDPQALQALERLLKRKQYQMLSASSAKDALAILKAQADAGEQIGVVISDYTIRGMNSIELLGKISKLYPDTIRILLTGDADMKVVVDGINTGAVHKFLFKPWNDRLLQKLLAEAFESHNLILENRRLTRELEAANHKLETVNATLENSVKQKAEELVKAVYYDSLTGLASRTLVRDRLDQAIGRMQGQQSKIAVFLIGLDRFKFINESLGHQAGDQVLIKVAERLKQGVRTADMVGRLGADVFCLVLNEQQGADSPGLVARRLFDVISAPLAIKNQNIFLTSSIGISLYPEDDEDAESLFLHAETAMRQAKLQGSNSYRYYSGEFNRAAVRHLALETELREAIVKHEFELFYQPRVDIEEGCIVGAEALLRWRHPVRGLLSPDDFFSVLEDTNLIQSVGRWVLEEGSAALKRWQSHGLSFLKLAINLSPRQFREKELPDIIQDIADRTGLDLNNHELEVEITERLLMDDVSIAHRMLKRLHDMGIMIAIDDFGTGYSALSYLIQFPLNYLKIDKSFVDRVDKNDDAKAIVEAIISLSYSLKLRVIAEGVENSRQLSALQALGCKQFQGYLFARPMPEKEFVELVQRDRGVSIVVQQPEDRLLVDGPPTSGRKFN
ncbi:MAG TPA: EAL domain-containing protein [Gammaproteobacteria bacterium]